MSAILKVLQNRKMEVELNSEVVELALIDDFTKQVMQGEKSSSAYVGSIIKAKDQLKNTIALFKAALKKAEDLKVKAKELGVDITKDKSYSSKMKIAESKLSEAERVLKAIS